MTKKVDKVQLVDLLSNETTTTGSLHITPSHIIFRSDDGSREIWISTGLIGVIERGSISANGCALTIRCKHFRVISLLVPRDKTCQDLYETLRKIGEVVNVKDLPAFDIRNPQTNSGGWNRLEFSIEFSRQGVSSEWQETDINQNYAICDTYPNRLWVPTNATKNILEGSSKFRSRGRLPVLTFFYKPSSAALCRCAQPLAGFSARCVEDEKLMELIGQANSTNNNICLVDTRPLMNSFVNKVQGKGYEDVRNYNNMQFKSFDIENIHVMRNSQQKLLDACSSGRTITEYLKGIESSGWLKHLKAIVECSLFIAQSLHKGISCVVHCSDGWDRTAQTVAIAQILLDPFFRTIHGLQVLIEKDWLAFGHKFDDRCGHVGALNDEAPKEISPVFTQFLDCVYQVMTQQPRAFQYNERYLIVIHEHVYSCQYGTFLGNCESDRKDLSLSKRTNSLWTELDTRQDDFLNPFYEPFAFNEILDLDTRSSNFSVWSSLYNRFDLAAHPRENMYDSLMNSMEHVGVLESHIAAMRMKIAELRGLSASMIDSGLSSTEGVDDKLVLESPSSKESVAESELELVDDHLGRRVIRWQRLNEVYNCSSKRCMAEFSSNVERKIHCHNCGKIFCRRCVDMTSDESERICLDCAKRNQ
ncbi:unnamed protein product [Auanema sp. JU1783]|nr:unnamed protein product [Auanema sp. JU1783]